MNLGVVMLAHRDFDRVAQLAERWAESGCPVVIHIDIKVPTSEFIKLSAELSRYKTIIISREFRCEWGTWGIVAATQSCCAIILRDFPEVSHVIVTSGSCVPLRHPRELAAYLTKTPGVDFIESVAITDVPWIINGLGIERFTLRFPFSWKARQKTFDRYVQVQRRLRLKRKIPQDLDPHIGSQWWCLTRKTLRAILNDPRRKTFEAYFRHVWIPDESYFQTLARRHSNSIESRSLTLGKFDPFGRPHTFYDDHFELLERSNSFVARKIWPRANRIWDHFLTVTENGSSKPIEPARQIVRLFDSAMQSRQIARRGLYMQGRYPMTERQKNASATPYCVFEGFVDLFQDFPRWFNRIADIQSHGHLFSKTGAEFASGQRYFAGTLSAEPILRDYNAAGFLHNLLWATRGQVQSFQFGPRDSQGISQTLAEDPNAFVNVISGAWIVPLYYLQLDFAIARKLAAKLQKIEANHLAALTSPNAMANVRIWSLADFIEAPERCIEVIFTSNLPIRVKDPGALPQLQDLTGIDVFLQRLKNQGMYPHLMGDLSTTRLHASPSTSKTDPK